MMSRNTDKKREQMQFFCMEDMVPQNHLLRNINRAINFSFIYDLMVDKYSEDQGRPSIDPVMLIKIPYKNCGSVCTACPYLEKCTLSKDHVKLVTRHVWEEYMEQCEEIRHTAGSKEIYEQRKETIERIFGAAKESHGLRYTQYLGKGRMEMKVGLTFTCLNLKKLVKMKRTFGVLGSLNIYQSLNRLFYVKCKKQHLAFSC